jgi:hypothetical protein
VSQGLPDAQVTVKQLTPKSNRLMSKKQKLWLRCPCDKDNEFDSVTGFAEIMCACADSLAPAAEAYNQYCETERDQND